MTMSGKLKTVAVLAGFLSLAGGWLACRRQGAEAVALRTVAVAEGVIEDVVEATGSVLPLNRVEISPPIGGRIEKLLVSEGDKVRQGQIIAWMSSTDRAAILNPSVKKPPSIPVTTMEKKALRESFSVYA